MSATPTSVPPLDAVRSALDARGRELGAVIELVPRSAERAGSDARVDPRQEAEPGTFALDGVAVAVKANIAVRSTAWSAGIGARSHLISADDATVVSALRSAGADIAAMLNMAEAALGATTNNVFFGIGRNPHDLTRTCGGSSGGSGAVVGSGLVSLALGTDTMGSVRVPAAYCGCVGFKPSNGLLPTSGVVPLSTVLDCVGPLASDVATALAALRAMAAPAAAGPWSAPASHRFQWDRPASLPNRLIVPTEVLTHDLEPEVEEAFERVIDALRLDGVEIVERPLGIDLARLRRRGLVLCEAEGAAVHAHLLAADPDGFSAHVRSMFAFGGSKTATELAAILQELLDMGVAIGNLLTDADGFLTPTTPQVAFTVDAPVPADQADFTAFANVAGLPAVSLPVPRHKGQMPVGIQLVGRRLADDQLGANALAVESVLRTMS